MIILITYIPNIEGRLYILHFYSLLPTYELTDVKDKNPEVSFSILWMEGWNLNPIHCKCLSAFHILLILTFLPSSDVVVLSYPQRTDSERVWNTPYILHWVGESHRTQDQIPRLLAQCFSHYNYSDCINLQIEIT